MSKSKSNAKTEAAAQPELTGSEIVIRALKDQGVKHIFGYPGGAVLPIYDALFEDNELIHVLVRHEQGAVHAAEGYARSTGKPGVVLVTSGPGATNAVTGLTDALMDSDSAGRDHRSGGDASDRQRRVPGMRHGRHHAALHQAQLAGARRERSARASCTRRSRSRPPGGRVPWSSTFRRTCSSRRRLCRPGEYHAPAPTGRRSIRTRARSATRSR